MPLNELLPCFRQHLGCSEPLLVHDPDILEGLVILKQQGDILLFRVFEHIDG